MKKYNYLFYISSILLFCAFLFLYSYKGWFAKPDEILRLNTLFVLSILIIVMSWRFFPSYLLVGFTVIATSTLAPVIRYLDINQFNMNDIANPFWLVLTAYFVGNTLLCKYTTFTAKKYRVK